MLLNIRGNVFMMRVRALQHWLVGMRLRIVPVQLFVILPGLVSVPINDEGRAIIQQAFAGNQPDSVVKVQFARHHASELPSRTNVRVERRTEGNC